MWILVALLAVLSGQAPESSSAGSLFEAAPAAALSVRLSHGLQMPERAMKGDLLPRVSASDPPGEVASIEIGGDFNRVVLRDYAGDLAFVVDAATATTTVVKGTSIPQLKLPSVRFP